MASHHGVEPSYQVGDAHETKNVPLFLARDEESPYHSGYDAIYGDNPADIKDMLRLGKKQEFKRNFSFISTLGFISIYMATWGFVLVSLAEGLINGGFAGLFWTFIGTVVCYSSIVSSLAEMESRAPTSGGQYHWESEFAPASCQKFLSYSAGWMSTLGWLASVASSVFVCSTLIQSLIEISQAEFVFPNWQYTLMSIAFLVITIFFNTWGAKTLPMIETVSLFGHMLCFAMTLVPLWVMCPKASAKEVFTSFVDNGRWGNIGTACLVSQVSVLYCNLGKTLSSLCPCPPSRRGKLTPASVGSDSACHISEEVEDASLTVPRVMWWSFIMNVAMGIVMLITMLFCIGTLDEALNAEVSYLQLFINTGSNAVALVLTILLLLLVFSGNITAMATTSREVFAFFYSAFAIVFSCFPSSLPQDISTANWAPAVWGGVILLSFVTYLLHGKKHFTAPVVFVEGMRTGALQGSD